jgi:hypothetical protein
MNRGAQSDVAYDLDSFRSRDYSARNIQAARFTMQFADLHQRATKDFWLLVFLKVSELEL